MIIQLIIIFQSNLGTVGETKLTLSQSNFRTVKAVNFPVYNIWKIIIRDTYTEFGISNSLHCLDLKQNSDGIFHKFSYFLKISYK